MKKGSLLLYFVLSVLLFTACKKDSTHPTDTPTPTNIAGVYRMTALKAQTANSPEVDVYDQLTECQQNDTWRFYTDGSFLFGGAAAADCGDPDLSGTWKLNRKTFTVTTDEATTDYQFISVGGNTLKLSIGGTLNEETATYYITFTKQ
jgi:hypothetical protein